MKKRMSGIVSLALIFGVLGGLPVSVSATGEPTVTWLIPQTMKIGDKINKLSSEPGTGADWIVAAGKNLTVGGVAFIDSNLIAYNTHAGGARNVLEDGTAKGCTSADVVFRPGKYSLQFQVADSSNLKNIGKPYMVTVEEPIIKTNEPKSIHVGTSFNLNAELTNTALKNQKINYKSDIGVHEVIYEPSFEIVEGANLVTRANVDFSNILTASEKFTFNGQGTVKIKIRYKQLLTCPTCFAYRDSSMKFIQINESLLYNPEKTVTINVTANTTTPSSSNTPPSSTSTSSNTSQTPSTSTNFETTSSAGTTSSKASEPPIVNNDPDTGIKIEADPGVVPPDTVIKAEEVKEGGNFTIINNALEHTSNKWVAYDISLLSQGAEIQPNGKMKITIPRPKGLNMNKMVLYHVAEDGSLTQIPFSMDSNKKNLIFETDHFSLYAVAEAVNDDTITDNQEPKSSSPVLWMVLSVAGLVLLSGAGAAVWYFKFHKKPTENE